MVILGMSASAVIYKKVIVFALIMGALFAAYSPALLNSYAHHDDYFLLNEPGDAMRMELNNALGRFSGTWIMRWLGQYATRIEDLTTIRWGVFFIFSLSAWSLYLFMQRYAEQKSHALLLSIAIFTLPPFQSFVSYCGASFIAPSILLGLWAAILAARGWDEVRQRPCFGWIGFAILMFLLALTIYPSGAMFFGVIPAILLTQSKQPFNRRFTVGTTFFAAVIGLGLYAVILKLCRIFIFSNFSYNAFYNPNSMTQDYIGKLMWFLDVPLFNSFNLWNIFPDEKWMLLTLAVIVSGAIVSTIVCRKSRSHYFIGLVFLFFLLAIFSFLPNFIAAANAPWYRCQVGLTSIVLIVLLWSIRVHLSVMRNPKHVLTAVLLVLVFVGIFMSQRNILLYRVNPSRQEIAYYQSQLKTAFAAGIENIHIIQPKWREKNRYDEFVTVSSHYPMDFFYMVYTIFVKMAEDDGWLVEGSSFPRPGEMIFNLRRQGGLDQGRNYSINLSYSLEGVKVDPPASVSVLKVPL